MVHRPEDTAEFNRLAERFGWDRELASLVLGHKAKWVKRWMAGDTDVARKDLGLMRRIEAALDSLPALEFDDELADPRVLDLTRMPNREFVQLLVAFGWDPFDQREYAQPPYFSTVSGIESAKVRLMAQGKLPVPETLATQLRALGAELRELNEDRLVWAEDRAERILNPAGRLGLEAAYGVAEA